MTSLQRELGQIEIPPPTAQQLERTLTDAQQYQQQRETDGGARVNEATGYRASNEWQPRANNTEDALLRTEHMQRVIAQMQLGKNSPYAQKYADVDRAAVMWRYQRELETMRANLDCTHPLQADLQKAMNKTRKMTGPKRTGNYYEFLYGTKKKKQH